MRKAVRVRPRQWATATSSVKSNYFRFAKSPLILCITSCRTLLAYARTYRRYLSCSEAIK